MEKKHIVLIDDCADYISLLKVFLKDENFSIASFEDPLLAKEYIKTNGDEIDLIILDLMMPKLSGLELLSELSELKESCKFKICVLSDKRNVFEIEETFKLGGDEYFLKSENIEVLVEKIYSFLDMKKLNEDEDRKDFISLLEITNVIHDFKVIDFDESHITLHSKEELPIHSTIQISCERLKKFNQTSNPINCIVDNCEILDENILITCRYLNRAA